MPISLNNSKDIVANSVSIIRGNRTIDLVESIDAVQGFAPSTLNSLEKLATAMNNDPAFFTTLSTSIGNKADKSNTYTQIVTNGLLDKKVDDTEMTDYALKTYVTTAVGTKQATLSNGTEVTNSKTILFGNIIKNILPGTNISLSSDDNKITINGIDAYTKSEVGVEIAKLVGTAPEVLNTLQEIAAVIGDSTSITTSLISSLSDKANTSDTF